MNLKFKIRKGKNSATIYLDFYALKEIRVRENTRFKMPIDSVKFWNKKTGKIKLPNSIPNSMTINETLSNYNNSLTKELNDLYEKNSLNIHSSRKVIKSILNPNPTNVIATKNTNLLAYYREYIEKHHTQISSHTRKKLSKGTLKTMNNTLNKLVQFEKGGKYLKFDDITETYMKNFISHLISLNYSDNYIGTIISKLGTILRYSYNEGLHENTIFQKQIFKRIYEEVNHVFLNSDEISKIQNLKIEDVQLSNARDIILIACYTGMRVADLIDFLKDDNKRIIRNKKRNLISHIQSKTQKEVYIPIHDKLQLMLNMRNGKFPKYLPVHILRKSIKILCRLAGINQTVEIIKTLGGKKVTITKKKYCVVSMHSCRRSFCTNAVLAGAHPQDVMLFSAHTNVKDFNNYVKASKLELVQTVLNNNMFRA